MNATPKFSAAPAAGMRDFLPQDVALRDWAISQITSTYERFGYTRIETPVMENINLLRGGEGGENLQLIFEVLKRGDKLERELRLGTDSGINRDALADLGLRFDLTVPLVRFYAHNISELPSPLKAIQIGSVFRAESPQAGRFRQFTQCDIDVIGVKSELAELELIQATSEALLALGFEDFKVRINDRRILAALAQAYGFPAEKSDRVFIALDKLDKIRIEGVRKELHTDGYSEGSINQICKFLQEAESASGKTDALRSALPETVTADVWQPVQNVIDAIEEIALHRYQIAFDPTLVRGMGYYTGMIFEISCPGYSSSVAGGGRYDKMVGKFSGRDVPACGFSIGFERIVSILSEKGFVPQTQRKKLALIVDLDRDRGLDILKAADKLRNQGYIVSVLGRKKEMSKQLDQLAAQGFEFHVPFRGSVEDLQIRELK